MIDYNLLHLPSFSLVKWRRFFNLLKGVGFCRLSLSSWLIGGRSGGFCQSRVQTNLQPGDPPPLSRGWKPPASAAPPYLSHHVDLSSGDTRRISRPFPPSCWIDHCGPIILRALSVHLRLCTSPHPHHSPFPVLSKKISICDEIVQCTFKQELEPLFSSFPKTSCSKQGFQYKPMSTSQS